MEMNCMGRGLISKALSWKDIRRPQVSRWLLSTTLPLEKITYMYNMSIIMWDPFINYLIETPLTNVMEKTGMYKGVKVALCSVQNNTHILICTIYICNQLRLNVNVKV